FGIAASCAHAGTARTGGGACAAPRPRSGAIHMARATSSRGAGRRTRAGVRRVVAKRQRGRIRSRLFSGGGRAWAQVLAVSCGRRRGPWHRLAALVAAWDVRMSYAELQVTTNFSFLRGASHAEELFARAAELGISALGIVDRNSLAGMVRAHEAAKATGVRLIVGCRLDLRDGTALLV